MSLFTRASAAIDRGALRFMGRQMAPRRRHDPVAKLGAGEARRRLIELAGAYNAAHALPSPFFATPELPKARIASIGPGPLGTQILDISYPSTYVPFLPAARELYASPGMANNAIARARLWTSGDHGRPTIVFLHGWGGGNHWVSARAFAVPYWLRHGFDVVSAVLPFHGARAFEGRSGARSGAGWPSPNPLRTNEGFGQAIHDLRALARLLRSRGATAVGALGMSLGGYTTALWASVAGNSDEHDDDTGLDFAVAMIPAVSMSRLMWRHGEDNPTRRRAAREGITEDLLADAFAIHAPLSRPVRLPPERLAVIAGRGDQITPPDQAKALAAHWGVDVHWFGGGHLAQVGRGDALRAVRRQLAELEFSGREFRS